MKSKLLKLLYDYSVNGKLVDNAFIEKLIDLVVNSKDIEEYVRGLIITDKDNVLTDPHSLLAAYYPDKKLIMIYMEAIDEMLKSYSSYEAMFSESEQVFYKNLLVTQVILHELEHANQKRIIDVESSLEGDILRASIVQVDQGLVDKLMRAGLTGRQIEVIIETQKTMKNDGYLGLPDERLAEIKSHQELADALSGIESVVPNLLDFEKTNILESRLRGYTYDKGVIVSPTIDYIVSTGRGLALQKFEWFNKDSRACLKNVQSKFSLDERLMYGLPIDKHEFMQSSRELLSSKKYSL